MYNTNKTVERIKLVAKQKNLKISDMLNACEINKKEINDYKATELQEM